MNRPVIPFAELMSPPLVPLSTPETMDRSVSPVNDLVRPHPVRRSTSEILGRSESPFIDLGLPRPPSDSSGHAARESTTAQIRLRPCNPGFIERFLQRGVEREVIVDAMERTCYDLFFAAALLCCWQNGEETPRRSGVFTEEDDRVMHGTSATAMRESIRYHGERLYNIRFDLLNDL